MPHVPGYNFLGPGTDLSKKRKPINDLDAAAERHDHAYNNPEYDIWQADLEFKSVAEQSRDAKGLGYISSKLIGLKHKLGLDNYFMGNVKRQKMNQMEAPEMMEEDNEGNATGTGGASGSYREGYGNVHPIGSLDVYRSIRQQRIVLEFVMASRVNIDMTGNYTNYILPYDFLNWWLPHGTEQRTLFNKQDAICYAKKCLSMEWSINHQSMERKQIQTTGGTNTETWMPANDINLVIAEEKNNPEKYKVPIADVRSATFSTVVPSIAAVQISSVNHMLTEIPSKHYHSRKVPIHNYWMAPYKDETQKDKTYGIPQLTGVQSYVFYDTWKTARLEENTTTSEGQGNWGSNKANVEYSFNPQIRVGCLPRRDVGGSMKFFAETEIIRKSRWEFLVPEYFDNTLPVTQGNYVKSKLFSNVEDDATKQLVFVVHNRINSVK